jgi:hypothetical protein
MPIDHEVLNDGEMLISTITGVITGDDLADHMFWQINQLGEILNKDYQHIFDTTSADNVDMDEDDMKRISQIILTYGQDRGKTATALVAVHPDIRKLSYYYKSLSQITEAIIEVFSDRLEAENWLTGLK